MIAMLLQDSLGEVGCEVVLARHGEGAFAAARTGRFDAAVVDLGLPDMSGHQVVCGLRALSPNLPVVIQSGYVMSVTEFADASTTVLEKPFPPEALVAAVCDLLGVAVPGSS